MARQNGLLEPEQTPVIRRLSSATASLDDLSIGPVVVVPPDLIDKPSNAHETAAALELAKRRLLEQDSSDSDITTRETPSETTTTDLYAFAFDIDGVLIRGGKPIPEAVEAMKVLNGQNQYGLKVPYIFVTNGGGKTE